MKYQIKANNKDITSAITNTLLSIKIIDSDGYKNDTCTIELADDTTLPLPEPKATLDIAFGENGNMQSMGRFVVDTVTVTTSDRRITIESHAANLTKNLAMPRRGTFKKVIIKSVLETIAQRHGLSVVVDKTLAGIIIEHITQTDESDLNFVTRMANAYGAVFSIKDDKLLFLTDALPTNSQGQVLESVTIKDLQSCQMTVSAGRSYKSAEARYIDLDNATPEIVMAGTESPTYQLKSQYPNKKEAYHAAQSALTALKKGKKQVELEVKNNTELHIKQPIVLKEVRQGIDGEYIITELYHTFAIGQLTTKVKATSKVE